MQFGHLAQRLFNVPIAIHPSKAEVVMAALAERLGIGRMMRLNGDAMSLVPLALEGEGYSYADRESRDTGYDLAGSVAIIPVHGTLVQKTGTLRPWSGMTGYDGIRQAFLTALYDPKVEAIVLDVDSPGGEVAGCFDLVDMIYQARGSKPIWSILNESAYSAAYAIASAADKIYVPRTGGTGSVGVICMHVDFSKALTEAGLQVTFITYGERKADGHREIPLTAEVLERFQADIDTMGELFVDTVARNRNLAASAVRDTQASTYLGKTGVEIGLADAIAAPDAAFRALLAELA
ncbi:signal peptide peptidase SppA [Azotobacter beijerinckii]|uniref:Signal peptide peptidase SppA n=1 Tax=Azotobacter beijerinckii TaxID=170623 RepID=A0A1H6XAD1_9GAMM|nr:S49 family peptidase [Azotobacter beijerinckii]SEJ21505.1 signal peptide peptidase SppA [Azotobacter beijerinckii]